MIVYTRGASVEEIAEQHRDAIRRCALRGYDVVEAAHDRPGEHTGFDAALRLLLAGEVDRIVFASKQVVPDYLESATDDVLFLPDRPGGQEPITQRRTRRLGRAVPRRRRGERGS